MSTVKNPPAFPVAIPEDGEYFQGMALRDWFAGQALSGWLADPSCGGDVEATARQMYAFADAMLAERAK